jgi:hypothetical protein
MSGRPRRNAGCSSNSRGNATRSDEADLARLASLNQASLKRRWRFGVRARGARHLSRPLMHRILACHVAEWLNELFALPIGRHDDEVHSAR